MKNQKKAEYMKKIWVLFLLTPCLIQAMDDGAGAAVEMQGLLAAAAQEGIGMEGVVPLGQVVVVDPAEVVGGGFDEEITRVRRHLRQRHQRETTIDRRYWSAYIACVAIQGISACALLGWATLFFAMPDNTVVEESATYLAGALAADLLNGAVLVAVGCRVLRARKRSIAIEEVAAPRVDRIRRLHEARLEQLHAHRQVPERRQVNWVAVQAEGREMPTLALLAAHAYQARFGDSFEDIDIVPHFAREAVVKAHLNATIPRKLQEQAIARDAAELRAIARCQEAGRT